MFQRRDEKIPEYLARLRNQANLCHFADHESEIYDQILDKATDIELKRHAIEKGLNFREFLNLAFVYEKPRHKRRRDECFRCGEIGHKSFDLLCTAKTKECTECHLTGHIAKMCNNKSYKRPLQQLTSFSEEKKIKFERMEGPMQGDPKFRETSKTAKNVELSKNHPDKGIVKENIKKVKIPAQKIVQKVIAQKIETKEKIEEKLKLDIKRAVSKPERNNR